jgi:hypothetical protein
MPDQSAEECVAEPGSSTHGRAWFCHGSLPQLREFEIGGEVGIIKIIYG